jgi:hypothetical protein
MHLDFTETQDKATRKNQTRIHNNKRRNKILPTEHTKTIFRMYNQETEIKEKNEKTNDK